MLVFATLKAAASHSGVTSRARKLPWIGSPSPGGEDVRKKKEKKINERILLFVILPKKVILT